MSSSEFARMGTELQSLLNLSRPPVAISFDPSESELAGLEKSSDAVTASCVFWTKALSRSFYTTPLQQQSCSVGAVTHGYRLAKDTVPGCGCADVDMMASVGWVAKEDIEGLPSIPMDKERRIAYSPLAQSSFVPDVVLLFCKASQAMMIMDAAPGSKVTSKPTCQGLPLAYAGQVVIGMGCTASRIRAGYSDDDIVVSIPAKSLGAFVKRLGPVAGAESAMRKALSGQ